MKTIIAITDFSANATHAVDYAFDLVLKLKANLTLCNSFMLLADMQPTGMISWPEHEYELLSEESETALNKLKERLTEKLNNTDTIGFKPEIKTMSTTGTICSTVSGLMGKTDIQLIVAGTHDKDRLRDFLFGNNINNLIDNVDYPLLMVPPAANKPIKKIAFATDLEFSETDECMLKQLVNIAKPLKAEIVMMHIYSEKNNTPIYQKWVSEFLADMAVKVNYSKMSFRILAGENPQKGLSCLCADEQIDVLAMVHHQQGFFNKLFKSSHSQKMAGEMNIPLLVIPAQCSLV